MSTASQKIELPDNYRLHMLQGEIAALLHDIGKYTCEFVSGQYHTHSKVFSEQLAIQPLRDILNASVPATCFSSLGTTKLKRLGDLLCWHHPTGEIYVYFGAQENEKSLPLELFILMCADTLDSASSKGGATFRAARGEKRSGRLNLDDASQKPIKESPFPYLATPFGEREKLLNFDELKKKSKQFQENLVQKLRNFNEVCTNGTQLSDFRDELLGFLQDSLGNELAETRIPNNDVSLWQHTYSTASLFKAMLAGHLLTEDTEYCNEKDDPITHKEKLAILGLCWSEDNLISRSFRPAEILGRRLRLDKAMEKLKDRLETHFCLGNEIYRDRDGIYFLLPALSRDKDGKIEEVLNAFTGEIDGILNGETGLGGELAWQARYLDVGQQISRLAEVIAGGDAVQIRAAGPAKPLWLEQWQGEQAKGKEVCPRCGYRPVDLRPVVSGSEGDDIAGGVCGWCTKYLQDGFRFRIEAQESMHDRQAKRLLATDASSRYLEFDIEKFFNQENEEERRRLALIQGIVDLRPFLSGRAFSSLLATRPEWYTHPGGTDDKSLEMNTWEAMLTATKTAWEQLSTKPDAIARHTLQQLFQDSRLGTMGDGRAIGADGDAKARNFLYNTVLAAPFTLELGKDDHVRLVNYALRQHPAPSRLARVWNTTLAFSRYPMTWCENAKVPYATITFDPGRFMLLVPANRSWELCQAIYAEYGECFSRVRHLLPLHLSATVFYWKSPLYIGIDAARRFAHLGLESSATPQWWRVSAQPQDDDSENPRLSLCDPFGRETSWRIPATLPDGRPDQHYGWFWKKGTSDRPLPLADLKEGDEIAVYPSSFDYEILDSTTRRYDIRPCHEQTRQRPHAFKRTNGPRPYPLTVLDAWKRVAPAFARADASQRKNLIELLARLHHDWIDRKNNAPYATDLRHLAEDALKNMLGRTVWDHHGHELLTMACDGSLFDLVEWQDYINR